MKTDFPTASVGSSQAPTAAVEKSQSASNTEFLTLPALLVELFVPATKITAKPQSGHDIG